MLELKKHVYLHLLGCNMLQHDVRGEYVRTQPDASSLTHSINSVCDLGGGSNAPTFQF